MKTAIASTACAANLSPAHVKVCGCGRRYDSAAWRALPLVGVLDLGPYPSLEMRNCPCSSTLAVELPLEVAA